ncbi:hypothetical protein AWV80_28025 [Cupriavidus sp. UYMU48A]|nr:hypothetical protein AWV80_28025 [Cupriavidus sp. UYMU48A]
MVRGDIDGGCFRAADGGGKIARPADSEDLCAFGKYRVGGKEGFNMTCAAYAESGNRAPPVPATRDAHGQIGQCTDTMLA